MKKNDELEWSSSPGFRYVAMCVVMLFKGIIFFVFPTAYAYFQRSVEDGWFVVSVFCWILGAWLVFLSCIEILARIGRHRLADELSDNGKYAVNDLRYAHTTVETYAQVNNYLGRSLISERIHNFISYYFGESKLVLGFGCLIGPIKIVETDYADIVSMRFVSSLDMLNFAGKIPGIEIELAGLSCKSCKLEALKVGKSRWRRGFSSCSGHKIVFGLVRGNTYLKMRMSQAESYKRFEEFRDKVMEMKRLNSGG